MKTSQIAGLALGALASLTLPAAAQVTAWKIDTANSEADFAVRHLGINTVHGSFRNITGTIRLDPSDLTKSQVEATIDLKSVDTGVEARDNHLRSSDFFDVVKFPAMTFRSTRVRKDGDGYILTGDLTIHGVTRSIDLKMDEPSREQVDQKGAIHRGFTATGQLNRRDYGLVWSGAAADGEAVVADSVKIELDVEATRQ